MNKIAIITLCGNDNCGNKLQNYASVKYLSDLGYDVHTIWVTNPYKDDNVKQILRMIKRYIYDYILSYKRTKYYLKFNKYLSIRERLVCDDDMKKIVKKYDYFIVGSDQVWNPSNFNNDSIFFLSLSEKKKNIAFSASFGVSSISDSYKTRYIKGLNNFNYISVREDAGKKIVDELIGRDDAEVLVDPTLLLTSEQWESMSMEPRQYKKMKNKKYILTYFLGKVSKERYQEIEKIAKMYNCEIVNFLNKDDPFYYGGPSEFLFMEKNAFLICTDSFHSSVFALIFNKPFIVFDREQINKENMNSRIDTLIRMFKLRNRKFNGKHITNENLNHNYDEAYKILNQERNKSKVFLTEALKERDSE